MFLVQIIYINIMYVLSLGVFLYCWFPFGYIIINKSVFNFLNVTPCFVSIYMHTMYALLHFTRVYIFKYFRQESIQKCSPKIIPMHVYIYQLSLSIGATLKYNLRYGHFLKWIILDFKTLIYRHHCMHHLFILVSIRCNPFSKSDSKTISSA